MKKLLKNAYILMSADSDPRKLNVLIDGNEIADLVDDVEVKNVEKNEPVEIYNFEGKLITPGFVNMHTHSSMTLFRGCADDVPFKEWLFDNLLPREDLLNSENVYYGATVAMMEMLSKGVTTFVDMYMFMDDVARAALNIGMRGYLSRGLAYDNDEGWERRIRENLATYEKYHNKDGLIKVGFGPHAPYTVPNVWLAEVGKLARKHDMHVQIHLHEAKWEKESYSLKYIEETGLFDNLTIAAHCVQCDDEDINVLSRNEVTVVHNPTSNLKLGNGVARIHKMMKENVNVTLGTDGCASNNGLDIMKEMYLAALLQKNDVSPESFRINDALRMAWENAGFGLNEKLGRIEEGSLADLAIIDLNLPEFQPLDINRIKSHLVYSANSKCVHATMVNGDFAYIDGKYPKLKENDVYEKLFKVYKELENNYSSIIASRVDEMQQA